MYKDKLNISEINVLKPCQFAELATPKWITGPAGDSSMIHGGKHLKIKKEWGEEGGVGGSHEGL